MTREQIEAVGEFACGLYHWRYRQGWTILDGGQVFVGSNYAGRVDDQRVTFDRAHDARRTVDLDTIMEARR